MRALTVKPGVANSAAVTDMPDPPTEDGPILVDTLGIGVCGTDLEIVRGDYGTAPQGSDRLIIGHESIGRVREAPEGSAFAKGDLVVGIVRRPDPTPCAFCAIGEWDMCQNGTYTERGIKEHHGYASEQYRITEPFLVKVDPKLGDVGVLLEPTSVVAKAWDHIERIGRRSAAWTGPRVLVCGAGPIGLLAAMLGVQRGHEVHVMDVATDGPKPKLVADLGATYHTDPLATLAPMADVVIECTGVPSVVGDALVHTGPDAIVCLTGVSSGGRSVPFDLGETNREWVLGNAVVFGSVNANRRHYEAGAAGLAAADKDWLGRLISRRVPLDQFADALVRQPTDVKTVISIGT
jgi:threonine dehydrogenase-like Zn-dependent dehydrogenase